ncbi:MAG: AtpZ/AtpI family protein [Pseudomonadota bacterium]|nr:AtpZ/AtpI family protein [Pseudomonadota bacterium]
MENDPENEKIDDLGVRIRHAADKNSGLPETKAADSPAGAMKASNTGYELVGTVLACVAIGWLIDRYLHTGPWGILIMMLVGFVAGIMNVWRALNGYDRSVGLHKTGEENRDADGR